MQREHWLYTIPLRLRSLFRREQADQDLDDELQDHVEQKTEEYVAEGLPPNEARRQALLKMGGLEKRKEECRDARRVNWIQDLIQDLHFGLRMLRKSPGFTVVAVLTLALGIGANTAVFSLLDAVLLQSLPYHDPARLVWLTQFAPRIDSTIVPAATFVAWRNANHTFQEVGAYADHLCDGNFNTGGESIRLDRCSEVTPNFFSLLGIEPRLGRRFSPEEGTPGAHRVMILSDGFWHRQFGADPAVLGKMIDLDGEPYTVIGVLPPSYEHPGALQPDAFVSLQLPSKPDWRERESDNMNVIARLRPGVATEQARVNLRMITQSLTKEYPQSLAEKLAGSEVEVMPLHEHIAGDTRPALLVLMGAVGLVLLIACANVANLLVARALARQKEFAVRATLGAPRFRIIRQLLTEGILLAVVGSIAGLTIAWATMQLVRSLQPASLAHFREVHLNGPALAFTLAISLGTGVLFSLMPTLLVSRPDLNDPLREGAGKATAGAIHRRHGNVLVALEMALALPLLVGAGLLIRSLRNLRAVDPGFDTRNVLTVQVTLTERDYSQLPQQKRFFDELLARIRSLPGVESAGGTTSLPFYYGFSRRENVEIQNRSAMPASRAPSVPVSRVTPDYFTSMRIPLVSGRFFTSEDHEGSLPVVIVSRDFVRRFLAGENPIGLHLRFPASHNKAEREFTIVGTVGDVRYFGLGGQLAPVIFMSAAQFPTSALTLTVRTRMNPQSVTAEIRKEVQALDREQPIYHVATMEQRVADSVGSQRFDALLVSLFALIAALLAAIGIFGVMHYAVTRRTHEIGIRMALGAQPRDVLLLALGQGAKLAGLGVAIGVCAALMLTRFTASLLFGVSPLDPATFVGVVILLAIIALAACYIPARRAMRVDPMVALRYE